MNPENTVSAFFGPFSVAFVSSYSAFINHLKNFFSGYESDRKPDFTINIFPSDKLPPPVINSQKIGICLVGGEDSFSIGADLIRGVFDFSRKECSITIHKDFFNFPLVDVFHSFLERFYHTLCKYTSLKSFFIHGCGVVRENSGYIFIGPHHSGKTTIGQLSWSPVLHDERIILLHDQKGFAIDSPPFLSTLRHHPFKPLLLERIYLIVKDSITIAKKAAPVLALRGLYNELVLPLTLSCSEGTNERFKKGMICFDIYKNVSMYELHFDKTGNIWSTIADMHSG